MIDIKQKNFIIMNVKLFAAGFVQIALVSSNVIFTAGHDYVMGATTSFVLSYIWTQNVKNINRGDGSSVLAYCIGCALGNVCGSLATNLLS